MKRILLLAALGFASLVGKADQAQYVVIHTTNGEKVAYALTEKPKVMFEADELIIQTTKVNIHYQLDQLNRITYVDPNATGIEDLRTQSPAKFEGNTLVFPHLASGSHVAIVAPNGAVVFEHTTTHEGNFSFPVAHLNSGAYIVKVNQVSYKIIKK